MFTAEMQESIKKVEATRAERMKTEPRRMTAEEKDTLLKAYHPDYREDGFVAVCRNPFLDKSIELGRYSTPEKAFQAYKVYKEDIIRQVAEVEYKKP